jgi:hypothetical protein
MDIEHECLRESANVIEVTLRSLPLEVGAVGLPARSYDPDDEGDREQQSGGDQRTIAAHKLA